MLYSTQYVLAYFMVDNVEQHIFLLELTKYNT